MRRAFQYRALLASVAWLSACGPDAEREAVAVKDLALTAQQLAERAARGTYDAGSFVAESKTLAEAFSTTSSTDCSQPPCPDGVICESTCEETEDPVTVEDLQEQRADVSEAIDKLVRKLKEEIFIPANLEAEDGNSATYRIPVDVLCSQTEVGEPTAGGPAPQPAEVDQECADKIGRLAPKVRLTSPATNSVDAAILLTPQQHNPITLQLRSDSVSAVVDLGELMATLVSTDNRPENVDSMSGQVQLELKRNQERDYSVRVNVLKSLAVTTVNEDDEKVKLSLAASTPSFELRFDGNARRVTGSYSFAGIGVQGPLNALRDLFDKETPSADGTPPKVYTGQIDAFLAGYDGSVELLGDEDLLKFKNFGFGNASSWIKFNQSVIASLDFNANAGRHLDFTFEKREDDSADIQLHPTLDASVLLNFAPLADQIQDLPEFALGDSLHLFFDGQDPAVRAESGQLRVVSGTLNLTSQRVPAANLQVAPGNCLFDAETESPAHELLGSLAAGSCK